MTKARRKGSKVYYNNDTDTWVNDSAEQFSLAPGSKEYEQYKAQLQIDDKHESDEQCEKSIEHDEHLSDKKSDEKDMIGSAYDVATRKHRRKMSKERQNKDIQKIVDGGLGKHTDIKGGFMGSIDLPSVTCKDEMYDDGIDAKHYKKEVIQDYKKEFKKVREVPVIDTDGDGKEDDTVMTPGMRKMAKYM
jgi:hypothetical protein